MDKRERIRKMEADDFTKIKICILGNTNVGKSSIVQRFVHNTFARSNETIGASYMRKVLFIKGVLYHLNIWDTAGQETFKALMPMYYRDAKICIVVYDVCSVDSFRVLKDWIKELHTYLNTECLVCIVGNKSDLEKDRVVTTQEGEQYAESVGAYFIETSARCGRNIEALFVNAISLYRDNVMSSQTSQNSSRRKSSGQRIILSKREDLQQPRYCCYK